MHTTIPSVLTDDCGLGRRHNGHADPNDLFDQAAADSEAIPLEAFEVQPEGDPDGPAETNGRPGRKRRRQRRPNFGRRRRTGPADHGGSGPDGGCERQAAEGDARPKHPFL